jgi:hypothetical protein
VSDILFAELVAALDLVVFERMPDGVFLRIGLGQPPAWFAQSFREASQGHPVTLAEAFPFLESFLPEAENLWRGGRSGRIRSEAFVVNLSGGELALVATALSIGHRHLLVIELPPDFDERRSALQGARDHALAREQLVGRIAALVAPAGAAVRLTDQLLATGLSAQQQQLATAVKETVTKVVKGLEQIAPPRSGVTRR